MHKKIGILGGMSPESTAEYYQYMTRTYTQRYGDHNYPEIIIYSVSFQPYIDWPANERWDLVAQGLSEAARKLEAAGADFIVIATNTMHMVIDELRSSVNIPFLSLLDAVGDAITEKNLKTVGLLGTVFTMKKTFYQEALAKKGITVLVPNPEDQKYINEVIYSELIAGVFRDESRAGYLKVIDKLAQHGAEGMILGCTEIPLLVGEKDTHLPLFDTTTIHAEAALDYAIS
ncbi:MAG: aspartate/glutamate racemase family protein [Anaerolineaceae bacterium]|nr:aspartate/glutamate racemase family protein [Anaerolineaceae bacterium]